MKLKIYLDTLKVNLPALLRETVAVVAVVLTLIAFDYAFLAHRTPMAWKFWEKGYRLEQAVVANAAVWYVPFTVIFIIAIFILFAFLGRERAEAMRFRKTRNPAALVRDYMCVLAISFIPATLAAGELTGTYRVPPGLLAGTVFCWIIPLMLVNMAGSAEGPRDTIRELVIIAVLVAAGRILPAAIAGYFSYRGFVEYLLSIAILYNLALGASIIVYNRVSMAVKVKHAALAYPFWLLSYTAGLVLLWLPVLLMIVVAVFASLGYLAYAAATGHHVASEDASSKIFFSLVLYRQEGINPFVAFAPFRFMSLYFQDMAVWALRGSPQAIAEILTLLASVHVILAKFRKKSTEN